MTASGNSIKIPPQNIDFLFKYLTDSYASQFFKVLQILPDGAKFEPRPSEISTVEYGVVSLDRVFMLEGRTILHLEFDSSGIPRDLCRYMRYAALLSYSYFMASESEMPYSVRTVVIYPGGVKLPPRVYASEGSLIYEIEQISVDEHIDGDQILSEISRTVQANPKVKLTGEDVVKFALAPLGKVRGKKPEFGRQAVRLAKSLAPAPDNDKAIALVACAVSTFLDAGELNSLMGG
ncbi:MAG: hypothetical protein LBJ64_06080 [Deltaproteobacteria bacterium]|jgi:hypothetical protein|nr:hypothetical protein [Deltaproteobacteria bacterium]